MQAIILAAGWGKRLQPITRTRSKAMAPILGKPIVERVMENLAVNGVDEFVVVASPEDIEITPYFEQESDLKGNVQFVYQEERLGTAHALQCAAHLIRGDFVLSACDNLIAKDQVARLLEIAQSSRRPNAVLTLMPVEPEQVSRGAVVDLEGPWVTRIVEKPKPEEALSNIYSLPLYCFSTAILEYLSDVRPSPRGEYEVQDAIQMLIERKGRVSGVIIPDRLTLTKPEDLLTINRYYLEHIAPPIYFAPGTLGLNTHLIPPLHVDNGTVIGRNCHIGPYVYVERGCRVGDGVTIQNAVMLRDSVVPDGAVIEEQVFSDAHSGSTSGSDPVP